MKLKQSILASLLIAPFVTAQEESFLERGKLLGDVNGHRSAAENKGIKLDAEYTSVYQGAASTDESGDNFGRFDIFASFDTEKLGLWKGGSFHTQMQAHHGQSNDFDYLGTPYIAPNTAGFMGEDLFLSSLYYLHQFESAGLMIGKIDAFELLKNADFYGGAGRYGFMNLALAAPPSGVVPPAFLGALVNWRSESINWTFMLFDPKDRYTDSGFSDPFANGLNMSLTASHTRDIAGRKSNISLSGTYSTSEGRDLSNPTDTQAISSGKYNLRVQASHNIYQSETDPSLAWGVYMRAAVADGNPNALNGTFSAGIGGNALLASRANDQWGVGYFYNDISDDFQSAIKQQNANFELADEQGVEAYYSYALTPAVSITTDIQFIKPAVNHDDTNILMGIRSNIRF
ncbi:carbohydrate porin [Psychromonas ossibalaenae]|uniref:carbohydrate porin n=1 Tax=Psychromonas ossibalaenae TaxID=444922 RepID=UPI0003800817|nr:carbohydrate porin [Psychromonas ossibalaenae]